MASTELAPPWKSKSSASIRIFAPTLSVEIPPDVLFRRAFAEARRTSISPYLVSRPTPWSWRPSSSRIIISALELSTVLTVLISISSPATAERIISVLKAVASSLPTRLTILSAMRLTRVPPSVTPDGRLGSTTSVSLPRNSMSLWSRISPAAWKRNVPVPSYVTGVR